MPILRSWNISPLGRNLVYLYLVQGANYLFPLLTLPYLARVLGPEGYGLLALGHALAYYIGLFVDYGFTLSGTRKVAQAQKDRQVLGHILSGVLGAKFLLLIPAGLLALVTHFSLPVLRGQGVLVFSAFFLACASSFTPVWFFQGLERLADVALLEVGTKAFATFAVFAFVRGPEDIYLTLLLQGLASLVATIVGFLWLYQQVEFCSFSFAKTWSFLKLGGSLFIFRVAVSLYTAANPIILSLFVPTGQVGIYSGAERLTKALLGMVDPFNRTFFPRLTHLVSTEPKRAAIFARTIVLIMFALGSAGALGTVLLAPWGVKVLLGPGYEESVHIVRVLCLLLPLIALSNALGIQWMLPWGLDRPFNIIIIFAGILNLALAPLLTYKWGAIGMAWAVVFVEAWVTSAMLVYLLMIGKLPYRSKL